jgi:chromosome segregation ATPase
VSDDPILSALARLETVLAAVQAGQNAMQADITGLKEDVSGLKEDVSGLKNGQTGLTGRLDRLEAGQTSLRVDLMARMDRLQNAIGAVQEDIHVNYFAATKATDDTRALALKVETQGLEIITMQQQILRLKTDVEELKKANGAKGA